MKVRISGHTHFQGKCLKRCRVGAVPCQTEFAHGEVALVSLVNNMAGQCQFGDNRRVTIKIGAVENALFCGLIVWRDQPAVTFGCDKPRLKAVGVGVHATPLERNNEFLDVVTAPAGDTLTELDSLRVLARRHTRPPVAAAYRDDFQDLTEAIQRQQFGVTLGDCDLRRGFG